MKKVLLLVLVLLINGCATVTYKVTQPDGTTIEGTYTRILTTSDKISAAIGDAKIEANGQRIDVETLKAAIDLAAKIGGGI